MSILPGAEPYPPRRSGEAGVLVCHGFTGSPQSVRPWADHLAAQGLTVSLPLLPGHGTRWEDLAVTGWQDWYARWTASCGRCWSAASRSSSAASRWAARWRCAWRPGTGTR